MTDNQFDDIFRNRLKDFNSDVPGDMWQRITKKDKDRKPFFIPRWIVIAVALLLVGAAGGYLLLNDHELNKAGKASEQTAVTAGKQAEHITGANTGQGRGDDANFDEQDIKRRTETNGKDNIIYPSASRNISNQKKYPAEKEISTEGNLQGNELNTNTKKNPVSDSVLNRLTTKENISTKQAQVKEDTAVTNADAAPAGNEDDDDYKDKFSIELYASPVLPINVIHSENSAYEKMLKDAGNMQFSYSFGARLDLRIAKHFSAKAGVEYKQVNQKMKFTDSSLSGETSTVNHYKSIDIPILFSYNTTLSAAIQASFTTGVTVNLSSSYSGAIPAIYGEVIHINGNNVYDRNTGVSIYLGARLSKSVGTKTEIFTQPYFQYRLKSMTNSFQPFTQKIHTAGIEFGLRYQLFKKEDNK